MTTARSMTTRLASLLAAVRGATADFLVILADFDERRLWVQLGYTSLFAYLHRELGLSKSSAFHRKVAAELLQRFPALVEPLRDGRLSMCSLAELARVLTPENQAEVVPRFFHRSATEAREVSVELCPRAEAAMRAAVVIMEGAGRAGTRRWGSTSEPPFESDPIASPASPSRSNKSPTVEPLTADLSRLHLTVSRRFLRKVDAARDGLSHAIPGASSEQVLEAALDLLLARQARRRGETERPLWRPRRSSPSQTPARQAFGEDWLAQLAAGP